MSLTAVTMQDGQSVRLVDPQPSMLTRAKSYRVRTSIVLPAKTRTPLSTSLAEAENQLWDSQRKFPKARADFIGCSISPTLTPEQVARRMVDYVESGLGGHSIMPGSASTLLPLVRFMPFWYGWLFSKVSVCQPAIIDIARSVLMLMARWPRLANW